ncbi:MAG TPA: trimethylamine methyltransferase family protein [Thermodesulfobacteriota bacterium]|nr:trimethylamine methyltransferase family protein [Thermodesulfobacteriota bacterium]
MNGFIGGQYTPLSEKNIVKIHETSLKILEEIGVKVALEEALQVFRKHGAKIDGEIVRIPLSTVEKALKLVPHQFLMAGREEKNDLYMEDKRVYLGTGGAALTVLDLEEEVARPGILQDIAHIAKLVDNLENVHFYLRPCVPQDIPKEVMDINQFYAALANTTKNVMAGVQSVQTARDVIEMAGMIAGGEKALLKRPFISFVTSWMVSPLHFATETTRVLLEVTKNKIPVALSSAPMAGSTAPVTLAGALAQVHAEQLSGIALTQLANPGSPVLYGAIPSMADLKWMTYVGGGIEFGLMNAAISQMAQYLQVPNYNSAGLTDSKIPDIQAGYEKAYSICLCVLAGSNYVHHAAGMLESMRAVAYEQYVIDNEIIGMALRLLRGIEIDEETLGFEAIREVGPSGNFLSSMHTIKYMRQEYFRQTLGDRQARETWEKAGSLDGRERARRRAKEILKTHSPKGIDPKIDQEIRKRFKILI